MNRRTDDVDELLGLAREAVHDEEFAAALSYLREAHSIAPLRQDVRRLLATILEEASVEDAPLPSYPDPDEETATEEYQEEEALADPETGEDLEESDEAEMPETAAQIFSPAPVRRDFRAAALCGRDAPRTPLEIHEPMAVAVEPQAEPVHVEETRTEGRSFFKPFTIKLVHKTQPPSPEPAAPVRERINPIVEQPERKSRSGRTVKQPVIEEPMNDPDAADAIALHQSRMIAQAVAYGMMIGFLGLSSGFSYYKFYHVPSPPKPTVVAVPKETAKASKSESSSRTQDEIIRLARDYISRDRLNDAIALLEPAAKPGSPVQQRDQVIGLLASAYDARGTKLLETNQMEESISFYKKAQELMPTKADYAVHLGNAYFYCGTLLGGDKAQKYLEDAAAVLTRAIELDGNNVLAYQRLATVYESLKRTPQARAAWIKIREIAPKSSEAEIAEQRLQTLTMAK